MTKLRHKNGPSLKKQNTEHIQKEPEKTRSQLRIDKENYNHLLEQLYIKENDNTSKFVRHVSTETSVIFS